MKKSIQRVICIVVIMAVELSAVACGKKTDNYVMESTTLNNQPVENANVTIITYTVPDFCRIDNNHLQLFNEELLADGYEYKLEIKYLKSNRYSENLENELNNGNTDVAFLGLDDGSNNIYNLIDSGLILNLDDILTSDKGSVVYEAFPDALWESVKSNGHIYSIPNTNADDQSIYAVFNKDYIEYEAIESWDGSIESIYEIIKNVEWDDELSPRFQYLLNDYRFEEMINCEIRNGLLYDYDTMQIVNPLESEKFISYLRVLEQMKDDGYMDDSVSYHENTVSSKALENLQSENFLVVLAAGEPDDIFIKDNFVIKKISPYLSTRISGSIGISSKTNNVNAVVDFLGLLYGEEKYGNILLYGNQDVDFKLIDGFAFNKDGTDMEDKFLTKLSLNLFINIYPVKGERYSYNRKEQYFSFYDDVKLSPFIGFEVDTGGNTIIPSDLDDFLNSLNWESLDKAVRDYSEILEADGIDEYLSSVRKQWDTYKQ